MGPRALSAASSLRRDGLGGGVGWESMTVPRWGNGAIADSSGAQRARLQVSLPGSGIIRRP